MTQIHRHSRIPGVVDPNAMGPVGNVALVSVDHFQVGGNGYLSGTHTVGSGSYRLLLVAIGHSATPLTYVKCNGVSMTQFGTVINAVSESHVDLWYKINPDSGANLIEAQSPDGNEYWSIGVADFINVSQINPLYNFTGNTETDGQSTIVVSGATTDLLLSWIENWWNAGQASTDQTLQWYSNIDGAWQGSGATAPGAASVTINWYTWSDNRTCCAAVMIRKA